MNAGPSKSLQDFPDELLVKLFSYLDIKSLLNVSVTEKRLYAIAQDDLLWAQFAAQEFSGQLNLELQPLQNVKTAYFTAKKDNAFRQQFGCTYLAEEWQISEELLCESFKGNLHRLAEVDKLVDKIRLITLGSMNKKNLIYSEYGININDLITVSQIKRTQQNLVIIGAMVGNLKMVKTFLSFSQKVFYGDPPIDNFYENLNESEKKFLFQVALTAVNHGQEAVLKYLVEIHGHKFQFDFTFQYCFTQGSPCKEATMLILKIFIDVGAKNRLINLLIENDSNIDEECVNALRSDNSAKGNQYSKCQTRKRSRHFPACSVS